MEKPNRNYWLHRITGGENALPVAFPLLYNERYLSIGWSFISEDKYASQIQQRGIDAINEIYAAKGADYSTNRYSLMRFVHEMRAGDYVVVPYLSEFSVYEIADDIILTNESNANIKMVDWTDYEIKKKGTHIYNADNNEIDLGFYRKVIPIVEHIDRKKYANDALLSRMKIRQTNADIDDLWEEVENSINAYKTQKSIKENGNSSHDADVNTLRDVVELCKSLHQNSELLQLSSIELQILANRIVAVFGINSSDANLLQNIGLADMRFLDTSLKVQKSGYNIPSGVHNIEISNTFQPSLVIKNITQSAIYLTPLFTNKQLISQSATIDFNDWYLSEIVLTQGEFRLTRSDVVNYFIIQQPLINSEKKIFCNLSNSGIKYQGTEIPIADDPIEVTFKQIIYELVESFRIEGILEFSTVDELASFIEKSRTLFVKSLSLQNFRLFTKFKTIDFQDRFTVIIGNNAKGKTTVLSAIRLLLYSMLPITLNKMQGYTYYGFYGAIPLRDVNRDILPQGGLDYHFPMTIEANFNQFGKISRTRKKESVKTQNRSRKLSDYFKQVNEDKSGNYRLPLISYCGVSRTKPLENTHSRNKIYNNRYDGYNSCLETHCSTGYLRSWLRELQNKAKQSSQAYEILKSFINAVCSCFKEERIVNIEYIYSEHKTTTNSVEVIDDIVLSKEDEEGNQMRLLLRSMSAGYRTMIGLIADLAYRCISLNPQLGKDAITGTYGIVLIDELDMHLHPSWQRHIVSDLMNCFPKLQFIVTTHSPFIVQSLRKEQIINLAGEIAVEDPQTGNLATNAYFMGVDSDRSVKFQTLEDDAYDFLSTIENKETTIDKIDTMMKEYALRYSDNPTYVAQLRIEANMAKSEKLYQLLKENRHETN